MNITALDIAAIVGYFILIGVFAYLTRRTRSFSEFSIARHSIPASMIFASMCASYIGPGYAVGMTSRGFATGYVFYFMAMGFVIQTVLVGIFIAPRLASKFRDCYTVGDVMARCYGSGAHLLSGIVSVGICVGFCSVMARIGGGMLSAITGWDLMLCILLISGGTALYTMTGGIRASIATDALQFGLFSIIIPVLLLIAALKTPDSSIIWERAQSLTSEGFSSFRAIQIVAVLLSFLLGETLVPPYANRALASKGATESRRGFIFAGSYGIVWLAIVITLGIYGHQFVAPGTAPDDVFLAMGSALLPSGAFGILLAALIAIVMSSQDSVINAGSVSVVRDVIGFRKDMADKPALLAGRVSTLMIAASAAFVARYSPGIIEGLLIIYSIWAPALLLPLLLGLFKRQTRHAAGLSAMLAGGLSSLIWQFVLKSPGEFPAILVGLVACFIAYLLGLRFGKKVSYHN